jgi:GT2 family glycosyltransferase
VNAAATTGATGAAPSPGAVAERVTAVVTLFNSGHIVGRALASLPEGVRVVAVDNASRDGGADIARAARPGVEVVALPVNGGFGRGCNAGLRLVRTEFAVVLNPDLTLAHDTLALCLGAADSRPDAAVLGAQEASLDGAPGSLQPADTVSGSFMVLRMAALDAIGLFDENIFMYFEDEDLCLRARRAGWTVGHVSGARVAHVGGGSTRPSFDSDDEKSRLWAQACAYFADKHAGAKEGRRASRKLRSYRLKGILGRFGFGPRARRHRALAEGLARYRRFGPEAMFRNVFTTVPAASEAAR